MSSLFGPVEPVPSERIRILADGARARLGDRALDVLDTPGHASHHVALVDSATGAVFTGDALGIHVPDVRALAPPHPPARLLRGAPAVQHPPDPRRGARERTDHLDEIVAHLQEEARRDVETGAEATIDLERFETLSSVRMNAMGIVRYWQKRAEREAALRAEQARA